VVKKQCKFSFTKEAQNEENSRRGDSVRKGCTADVVGFKFRDVAESKFTLHEFAK